MSLIRPFSGLDGALVNLFNRCFMHILIRMVSTDMDSRLRHHPLVRIGGMTACCICALLALSELCYLMFPRYYLKWTPFAGPVWYAFVESNFKTTAAIAAYGEEEEHHLQLMQETRTRLVQDFPEAIIDHLLVYHQARYNKDPLPIGFDTELDRNWQQWAFRKLEHDLLRDCRKTDESVRRIQVHLAVLFGKHKMDLAFWHVCSSSRELDGHLFAQPEPAMAQGVLDMLGEDLNEDLSRAVEAYCLHWLDLDKGGRISDIALAKAGADVIDQDGLQMSVQVLLRRLHRHVKDELVWKLLDHLDYCNGASLRPVLDILLGNEEIRADMYYLRKLLPFSDPRVEQALMDLWLHASGRDLHSLHGSLLKQGRLRYGDIAWWRQALQRDTSEEDLQFLLYGLEVIPVAEQRALRAEIKELCAFPSEMVSYKAKSILQDL